jgi:aspartyl-tRNA(Asn)/glutamyl-tRNA(Gln) amidotransferase subunit C
MAERADASRASMSIDQSTVRRIANLARIAIGDEEADQLVPELSRIIEMVAQLQAVDTAGVAPMAAVIPHPMPMREDVVTDGNRRDDILANAPEKAQGFFAVPKVIE